MISKCKLPLLVVCLGQACTLKCKNCANFAPYSLKENLVYDVDKVKKDLSDILRVTKYIDVLQLQGGEPFCINTIGDILEFLLPVEKVKKIVIATNGTIIPKKYVGLLQSDKVEIRISNYNVVDEERIKELVEFLNENQIKHVFYDFSYGDAKWIDCGGIDIVREENTEKVKSIYEKCNFNHCLTLENGYIGKCSRCINAAMIQGFHPKSNDLIDLRNSKNLRLDIQNYKLKCVAEKGFFMEACRYCYGTFYGKQVNPAIQIEKK